MQIVRGKLDRPWRVTIYGCEGLGKSTLASNTPAPIFIGAEDGTSQLDVARLEEPRLWEDVLKCVEELHNDHEFKTVVLDTLDWAEPLVHDWVCRNVPGEKGKKCSNIEDYGYGKGYIHAGSVWHGFLKRLDVLRSKKGMNVMLVAHSHVKNFKNPEGDDYDRFEMKLRQASAGLIKEWSDAVLFANYETLTLEQDGRKKGIADGSRVVYTERRASWDAKNRYGMPPKLPLDWSEIEASMKRDHSADAAVTVAAIMAAAEVLPEDLRRKVADGMKRAGGDPTKLAQLLNWIGTKGQK